MDTSVFIPQFWPISKFLVPAGRHSLILIYIAFAGILLRRFIPVHWRALHALIWVAVIPGIVHGNLIGTDLKNPAVFMIFNTLAVV